MVGGSARACWLAYKRLKTASVSSVLPWLQVQVNGQVVTEPGRQVDLRKDKVRLQQAGEADTNCVVWLVAPCKCSRGMGGWCKLQGQRRASIAGQSHVASAMHQYYDMPLCCWPGDGQRAGDQRRCRAAQVLLCPQQAKGLHLQVRLASSTLLAGCRL